MDSANVGESKTTNNTTSNNEQNDRKENRGNSTNNPVKNQNNSNRGRKSQKRKDESTDDNMNKKFTRNRKWDGKTRRDKNVDTRPAEEVEEGEKEERRPKKKVACFIGYSGEGYHGMQFNGSMKTIEKDIYDAFAKAGAILKANASDPGKSSLQRAARTDKGVHAAGNLISLKMMIGDNPDELAQKINEHLPPQIRIYGIQRANNAFNSHIHCDSRVYEYIIPSHCFLPPKPGSTASTYARSIESQGREAEPEDTFWDNVVGPDFYSLLQRQISQKRDPPEDRLPELSSEESSRLQKMKADETEAIRSFRLSPSRLSRIRSAFNVYLGTHNFHNLTIGVPVHSSHAQRYIMSINIAEPKIYGSTEWLRIKIHGQSFMLHQIRKMIGAVLMAIRYGVGEESIRQILTTRADMHIPKAPAQGLLLERPVFTGISEKIKKFGNEALDWKPYEEKIEKFKEDFIYKSIFREITAENIFHEFINFMDSFKYDEKEGLAMIAQRPTVESVETFERDEEDEKDIRGDSEQAVG